ncbi:MAG: phosphatase PAP2 family protein [Halobacteriota archaeon]
MGVTDALHNAAEWPVIVLFGLITQLGDVWFLLLIAGVLYIGGTTLPRIGIDRRRGLFVFALVLTYISLIGTVKAVFQLPRPPGAGTPPDLSWVPSFLAVLIENMTTAESHGFPSGHALGSTMVWGGLALVLEREPATKRFGFASGLILLIAASRLVLGLHYVVDVVAGITLGAVVLGFLYWVADNGTKPGAVLLVAVGFGVAGLLVGITFDSVAACGGAVGGWIAWRVVAETTPAQPANRRDVLRGVLIFGAAAALFGGLTAIEPPLSVTFLGAAASAGMVVGAPLLSTEFGSSSAST